MYAIEMNNLTKYYGKVRGVVDLNFKISEGDIFGLIDPQWFGYVYNDQSSAWYD